MARGEKIEKKGFFFLFLFFCFRASALVSKRQPQREGQQHSSAHEGTATLVAAQPAREGSVSPAGSRSPHQFTLSECVHFATTRSAPLGRAYLVQEESETEKKKKKELHSSRWVSVAKTHLLKEEIHAPM
jgi:hypothetical protein